MGEKIPHHYVIHATPSFVSIVATNQAQASLAAKALITYWEAVKKNMINPSDFTFVMIGVEGKNEPQVIKLGKGVGDKK